VVHNDGVHLASNVPLRLEEMIVLGLVQAYEHALDEAMVVVGHGAKRGKEVTITKLSLANVGEVNPRMRETPLPPFSL